MEGFLGQLIALLTFLIAVAASVTVAVEQTKPVWKKFVLEKGNEQWYLGTIYVLRTVVSLFTLYQLGGAATVLQFVPSLSFIPESGLLFLATLLVTFGAEVLVPILDILTRLSTPVTPALVTSTKTEVVLPATSSTENHG